MAKAVSYNAQRRCKRLTEFTDTDDKEEEEEVEQD